MKLKEVIPFQSTPPFFQYLDSAMTAKIRALSGVPSVTKMQLVFVSKYGERTILPAIENYFEFKGLDITKPSSAIYSPLMDFAVLDWNKYYKLWDNVVLADYNPLDNYNGTTTKTTTYDLKGTEGNKRVDQRNYGATAEQSYNSQVQFDADNSGSSTVVKNDTENSLQGFNSGNYNNVAKTANSGNSNTGEKKNETTRHLGSDTLTKGGNDTFNITDDGDSTKTGTEKVEENKHGNLGVRSSQEMLTQEIEFRMWNFFDQLFQDIAENISLPIYEES